MYELAMFELALFAGAGGGILGGHLCGFTCVGAVEIEEYPREVLKQRQRDRILPKFPIWDDVCTFRIDNPECREYIELLREHRENLIISGGFPCQDISSAGKGAGITKDTRSGLWFEFARIIDEIRPARVLVENSPMLTSRGLGVVLGDLAEMGYDARWGVLGAVDVGAPHKRERIWLLCSNSNMQSRFTEQERQHKRPEKLNGCSRGKMATSFANSRDNRNVERVRKLREGEQASCGGAGLGGGEEVYESREWWTTEPKLGRVANGVAKRVDRLKAIGNGQVPQCVFAAWRTLR